MNLPFQFGNSYKIVKDDGKEVTAYTRTIFSKRMKADSQAVLAAAVKHARMA